MTLRRECRVARGSRHLFCFETNLGEFEAESFVIARGTVHPEAGSHAFRLSGREQLDCEIVPRDPGLVPLTFGQDERDAFAAFSGVSVEVDRARGRPSVSRESSLTHRGLSGPAVLQASNYPATRRVDRGRSVAGRSSARIAVRGGRPVARARCSSEHLPRRFARRGAIVIAASRPMNQIARRDRNDRGRGCTPGSSCRRRTKDSPRPKSPWAESTPAALLEDDGSQRVPGLYFIGEVVDVTGWLGGYNFQWAWASGFAAGQYA